MASTLPQISRRAIANAQSLLKFEKDRPAVYRDCMHDKIALKDMGAAGRLYDLTFLLLRATELASVGEDSGAAPKLTLLALCAWVEDELAWQREPAE